jgi:hypothetical protein
MASIIKFPRSLDSPVPRAARPRSALKYLEGVRGKGIEKASFPAWSKASGLPLFSCGRY